MPAGRHVTPGICEEDRKYAKYIIQIWGEGRNLGIASASDCDLGDVVRVETWGCSGWITSRETFYIIPGPIHWAGSTSCLLDSTTALPSSRPGRPGSKDFARGCSLFLASRQAARQQGQGPPGSSRPGY